MAEKRYMNEEGKIVSNYHMVPCANWECDSCPNAKKNNGLDVYCGAYFIKDRSAWMKNKGYREIFELENYTDEYYVMNCENEAEAEVFARFLDKNGRTWHDKRSYIKDDVWRRGRGTGFIFNRGFQTGCTNQVTDYQGNKYIHLNFKDYVFKTEEKKVKKDLRKLIKPGYMLEDMEGTRYLATEYLDDGGVVRIGLVEDDKSADYLTAYDTDLRYKGASVTDYDIVKIWGLARDPGFIDDVFTFVDDQHRDIIWEREEVKEMTVAEIEKELGYSIKVVK